MDLLELATALSKEKDGYKDDLYDLMENYEVMAWLVKKNGVNKTIKILSETLDMLDEQSKN